MSAIHSLHEAYGSLHPAALLRARTRHDFCLTQTQTVSSGKTTTLLWRAAGHFYLLKVWHKNMLYLGQALPGSSLKHFPADMPYLGYNGSFCLFGNLYKLFHGLGALRDTPLVCMLAQHASCMCDSSLLLPPLSVPAFSYLYQPHSKHRPLLSKLSIYLLCLARACLRRTPPVPQVTEGTFYRRDRRTGRRSWGRQVGRCGDRRLGGPHTYFLRCPSSPRLAAAVALILICFRQATLPKGQQTWHGHVATMLQHARTHRAHLC